MQIGEKVRFLNEVGGGIVTGFQGKDIVLVEDEDGFNIPMLRSQVVVVETNANNFVRKPKAQNPIRGKEELEPAATAPIDRPVSFQPKAKERKGGELLNVCLAFVPENDRELTNTRFQGYLINDSNYFVSVCFANNEGAAWHLRWQGTIEPNTKQLVETFDRSILNDLQRLSIQLIAWKQDKPYMMKPAVAVELRLDTVKFYKLHVFRPSPFFREPALIYDIVRDDRPIRQVFVQAEEVLDAMRGEEFASEPSSPAPSVASSLAQAPPSLAPTGRAGEGPSLRTRAEEREALKAAKRALKAEQQAKWTDPTILEVDLHINALLDNTAGLSPSVLLNTQMTEFRIIMDRHIRKKGQRIVFIHGKGDGVLREAIIKELHRRYHGCTYEDADFQRYGHGATLVTIK